MYQLTTFNVILRLSDMAFIQPTEGNRDWEEYRLWKSGGNAPLPEPARDLQPTYTALLAAINSACESSITSGFLSEALGDSYQYSSQLDDQMNLTSAILTGEDSLYACRDQLGVRDLRLHTAVQLRQVGNDFNQFKLELLQKANRLKQQLDIALEATDLDAMNAVTWESEQ